MKYFRGIYLQHYRIADLIGSLHDIFHLVGPYGWDDRNAVGKHYFPHLIKIQYNPLLFGCCTQDFLRAFLIRCEILQEGLGRLQKQLQVQVISVHIYKSPYSLLRCDKGRNSPVLYQRPCFIHLCYTQPCRE